jgi:hypothetical protein
MMFARGFIDLQFTFAERVQALSGMPLARALLEYTNLHVRFGLGRELDGEHPTWQAFLTELRATDDGRACAYGFYARNAEASTAPPVAARFGCFSYALHGRDLVRLHFRNATPEGGSPLTTARMAERRAELAALFAHVRSMASADAQVLGVSWLYHLEAYRRLFPPSYGGARRVVRGRFQSMSLWGQFLDHRGELKPGLELRFRSALAEHPTLADVDGCFPLQPLTVQAPARVFYEHYGV